MVNKILNWEKNKFRIIGINTYNISNVGLDSFKSFYHEEMKYL